MPASPLLLFITLNGTNHPLAACRWLRVGPDGCVTGHLPGDTVTSPAAAAAVFTHSQRDRLREAKRGIRYRLVTPDQWQAAKPCLLGDCTHGAQEDAQAAA